MNSPRPNGFGFKFFNSLLGRFQIISKRQNSCFYEIKTPCVSCRKLFCIRSDEGGMGGAAAVGEFTSLTDSDSRAIISPIKK